MVGCCIVLKLTTKPMLIFWVDKAELIELGFQCHMSVNRTWEMQQGSYATKIASYNKQMNESTNF